ncbi:MAG: CRISPR-associated protein [Candidatus Scalindua rubra]|uniref:CRISPR-associated protein n=1 Tax=Candidatus Scalindua rubra TaxID=1872076 RepID=A0A1E3X7I0_9BACT|nr:MAG: CRISPR-associated protein [Candidatus Scalindua rubra]
MYTLTSFIKEKWLEIAIIAIAIQLITNAFSIFLENKPVVIASAAIALLLVVAIVVSVSSIIQSKRRKIGEGKALSIKRKGVIFTIGFTSHLSNSPALKVIKTLRPQYCAFIGTQQTLESQVGKSIAKAANIGKDEYREKAVEPTNIREIKEDTEHLINWMLDQGLSLKDIVVDITSGTSIMSIAAHIASDERTVDTQYVYSEYKDNKPVPETQKALLVSKYER